MLLKENGWFLAILLSYFASSSLSSFANGSFVYHPVIWLGGGVALIALLTLPKSVKTTAWILLATAVGSIGAHEWGIMLTKQIINSQTYILNAVGLGLSEVCQVYLIYKLVTYFNINYRRLVTVSEIFSFFIGAILTGTVVGIALKAGVVKLHWELFSKGIMTTDYYSWFTAELLSVFVSSILFLSIYYRKTELWKRRLWEVCLPVVITYFFVSTLSIVACPSEQESVFLPVPLNEGHDEIASGCRIAGAGEGFNFTLLIAMLLLSGRSFVSASALKRNASELKRNASEVTDINRKLNDTLTSSWLMNKGLMTQGKIADIAAETSFRIAAIEFLVVGIASGQGGSQFFGYRKDDVDAAALDPEEERGQAGFYSDLLDLEEFYQQIAAVTQGLSSFDVNMYPEDSADNGYFTVYVKEGTALSNNDTALLKTIAQSAGVATANLGTLLKEKENSNRLMQSDTVINTANEGIFITDSQFRIKQINPSFSKISGYTKRDVMERLLYRLPIHMLDSGLFSIIRKSIIDSDKWEGEVNCKHKSGEMFTIRLSLIAVHDGSGDHYYAGVFSDITHFKENAEMLQYQADHDDLTGLANRKRFNRELQSILNEQNKDRDRCGLLYIDLDKFKQVNDNMGHQAGDELLKQVAGRLKRCVRESDVISRLGGDEFAVILKNLKSLDAIERIAEKVLAELSRQFDLNAGPAFISCSIGISVYPDHGQDYVELLRFADDAMYETKREGRNGFKSYAPEMSELTSKRYEIENDLRLAFEGDQLELYYQPQAMVYDDKLVGLEALIRWNHPVKGLIPPKDFLDVASESGFMRQLDAWVLNEGFMTFKQWQDQGIEPERLSLNISGVQITDHAFVDQLQDLITKYGISPDSIELEISENFVMRHADKAIAILNEIKNMGFHLSIDDFGTGYSSLSYLKKLPIDTLKIDGSFVRDVIEDKDDASIAIAIITLAHNMRMRVIAEGVETEGQKHFLMKNKSDIYQGYLYSRPISGKEIIKHLQKAKDIEQVA